ncbi:MAG: sigma-70 family RNA polymerase sigma factor [Flavobacteriales bacterium]|nr:sigma-70 family RNA polymerase sigma factor [Flavobacteriales bacterium]
MEEGELIRCLLEETPTRENQALRFIYREYYTQIRSIVIRNRGSEDDAREVFQEGIIALHKNIRTGKFRGESALGSYLYAICRLLWLKKLRKNSQSPLLIEDKEKYSEDIASSEFDIEWIERNESQERAISALFAHLGEVCRTILRLYYYENKTMKEIAGATGFKDEQNARNKKAKCINALRSLIDASPQTGLWLRGLYQYK